MINKIDHATLVAWNESLDLDVTKYTKSDGQLGRDVPAELFMIVHLP